MLGLLLLSCLLSVTCHPYRIPNPGGPPPPKVRKAKKADVETAAGTAAPSLTEAKPIKNNYDKHGLIKTKKPMPHRQQHKVGQRRFLGFTLPF